MIGATAVLDVARDVLHAREQRVRAVGDLARVDPHDGRRVERARHALRDVTLGAERSGHGVAETRVGEQPTVELERALEHAAARVTGRDGDANRAAQVALWRADRDRRHVRVVEHDREREEARPRLAAAHRARELAADADPQRVGAVSVAAHAACRQLDRWPADVAAGGRDVLPLARVPGLDHERRDRPGGRRRRGERGSSTRAA